MISFASYSDESGADGLHNRAGIAIVLATVKAWDAFEAAWRLRLDQQPGHDFHAKRNNPAQRAMNLALAELMKERTSSFCLTLRESDYLAATTPEERSTYGNVFRFLRYANLIFFGDMAQRAGITDVGYYVEQGGPGIDLYMQILGAIYRSDDLRRRFAMSAYGPSDRRVHLPAHTADLVSHEVITARHTSEPLKILGDAVEIHDVTKDEVMAVVPEMMKVRRQIRKHIKEHSGRKART